MGNIQGPYFYYKKRHKSRKGNSIFEADYWALMKYVGPSGTHRMVKLLGRVDRIDTEEMLARAHEAMYKDLRGVPIETKVKDIPEGCPAADGKCPYWAHEKQWCNWTGEKVTNSRRCIKWGWIQKGI